MRVLEKLRKHNHRNLVHILRHGKLQRSEYYYIDMPVYDLNLDNYIQGNWKHYEKKGLYFDVQSGKKTLSPVWSIMKDITCGIAFIHSLREAHRDLKPRNGIKWFVMNLRKVLYAQTQDMWKVTDFGTAAETTSKREHTTRFSRGTECYRAPEVLHGDRPRFTNKCDIWALGCILFELVTLKKAFKGDFETMKFAESGKTFLVTSTQTSGLVDVAADYFSELVQTMLCVDSSRRPSAKHLERTLGMISNEVQLDSMPTTGPQRRRHSRCMVPMTS